MNTEKLEKLKKSLDNKFIPDNMKEKIRAEIQKLEMDIKKDENITATEVKEEVKEIEKKVEVALEVAEKKEEQAEAKKPSTTRKTRTKKTVEPKASTARKTRTKKAVEPKTTTNTSKTDKKSIYTIAKEIRKPNESWNDAVKRAGASMRGESKEVTKKVSTELQKLKAFVKTRKELKGISGTNLLRDSKTKGQPRGKRVSDEGNVYYEYRDNRTDRLAPNYPKNSPYLADGGVILDNVEVKAYKGFHGLKAENYFENVNGYDWNVITMKRYSGDLVSSARGGQHTNSNGVEMFTFDFDSPNIKLVSSKPSRVTEKVVELQHALALQTFKEKMESKNFADGGGLKELNTEVILTENKTNGAKWKGVVKPFMLESIEKNQYSGGFKRYEIDIYDEVEREPTKEEIKKANEFFDKVGGRFTNGGYNEGIEEDIDMTDDYVLRVNKGVEPKDRASMREFIAKTNESREAMTYELGGAFMQTDLAGNTGGGTLGLSPNMPLSGVSGTHYTGLVGETGALSSGEMFKGGGEVSKEEKLLKELYKLQRELNSSRLQTYRLGDTSDEEMARQRERASKLERFNEVLKELNEYAGGGNLSRDRKYVNYREDYEVRYSKGKGRHGYGNLKFANGGAMMANQQVIDDASQHYVNYYLNDGASAGMFKDGGAIKNQYAGRTPEDIWNNLSRGQRSHFLYDHMDEIQEYKDINRLSTSQIRVAINSDWMSLDKDIKNRFSNHVREGQYATGGMMPKVSTRKHRNE